MKQQIRIKVGQEIIDLFEDKPLSEIIEILKEYEKELSTYERVDIDVENYYEGYPSIDLYGVREETDEEERIRLKKEQGFIKEREEKEIKEYLRLQEKYGNRK